MRTIAIINQKGGCGKTTTAINLAAMLSRAGKRTLLIDLDSQSHCAAGLGIPESKIDMDIGDAMLAAGNKPIDLARLLWQPAANFDLAPSRMRLAGLEAPRGGLANLADKERRLSTAIQHIGGKYDLICIDCAPSIGLLTYNALVAADVVLIPVETSFFSLQGATRQVNTVRSLSRKLGIHRPVWILPTIHDATNAVANDLLAELYKRFGERVVPTVIRRDVKLREAASFGQSIIDYAPGSTGFEDYARLAEWVIVHWAIHGQVDTALAEALSAAEELEPDSAAEVQDEYGAEQTESEVLVGAVHNQGAAAPGLFPRASRFLLPSPSSPSPSTVSAASVAGAASTHEVKAPAEPRPGNRAEEVARRAQDFLRRVALGKVASAASDSAGGSGGSATAPSDARQSAPGSQPLAPSQTLRLAPDPAPARPIGSSVHRLLGAHESNQGVLFVQPASVGAVVTIAGEFNKWSPTSLPLRRNAELGVFEICLKLQAGKWHYRIIIDGEWSADPYNNQCEVNQYGEVNSFVLVGSGAAPGTSPTAPQVRSSLSQSSAEGVTHR